MASLERAISPGRWRSLEVPSSDMTAAAVDVVNPMVDEVLYFACVARDDPLESSRRFLWGLVHKLPEVMIVTSGVTEGPAFTYDFGLLFLNFL
jgi:hypothetical protein